MTETKNESLPNQAPINFQIKVINGSVVLDFGRDLQWIGFNKQEALKIAKFMRKAALSL